MRKQAELRLGLVFCFEYVHHARNDHQAIAYDLLCTAPFPVLSRQGVRWIYTTAAFFVVVA